MLNIYRFDHIGQVVPGLAPQVTLLEGLFGFRKRRSWESAEEGCRGVLLDVPSSWGHRWEVLEPLGDNSPLQAFLDGPRGPGIHHIAAEVTDLDAAVKELDRLEISVERRSSGVTKSWVEFPFFPPEQEEGLRWRIFGPSVPGGCGDKGFLPTDAPFEGSGSPSLGIVAIDQIGHAYRDRDELRKWGEKVAGMQEVYRTPEGAWPDMATMVLTIPGTQIRWEIIQPVGENSFVQRTLDKRGATCNHVTFEVADWDKALQACEHHQIPTFGSNEGETEGARWRDTFIHPKYTGGVPVQFFWEERPGVWSRSDKVPPGR